MAEQLEFAKIAEGEGVEVYEYAVPPGEEELDMDPRHLNQAVKQFKDEEIIGMELYPDRVRVKVAKGAE